MFRNNIWGVDLAHMQSLSKYNKGIKYLFCAIDLFSKYTWVISFKKIISKGRKPNKIWVDQGSEFYNQSFKDFLKIKCTQHTMKENLLLLRDLLEL